MEDESGDSDDNAMHQKDAEDVEGSDDDEDKCSGCDKCCLDNFLSPFKDYVMTLGDGGSLIFLDQVNGLIQSHWVQSN